MFSLFTGTVRHNLDIGAKCGNDERRIWEALEMVEMKETICSLSGGLDAKIVEGMK
jgi:ABC-type multidrug transport system fused ATPase/permease subunit